jgi:3-phosphoshikimate 1-carboxyvinyltransferase
MLRAFGVQVDVREGHAAVRGGQRLVGTSIPVPADISSAAFFLLAASIVPGSELLLRDVGVNPTRTGVIDVLRAMGARIDLENPRTFGGEPVADLRVHGQGLRGIAVDPALVASAIDEFPAIFIAAACAEGETLVTGAQELRVKESDRIQTMVDGLTALGIEAIATPDGARIRGGRIGGGQIESHGDHRIAMSFAISALRATGPIRILDCENVNTSFPGFARLAGSIGVGITQA